MNAVDELALDIPVPGDWFDLLADDSDDAALGRFESFVAQSLPLAGPEQRSTVVNAMLNWRRYLAGQGMVMHGIVHGPHPDGGHASWQILAQGVPMPAAEEVDLAVLTSRLFGSRIDPEASVIETFETDLGSGVGLIAQPEIQPSGAFPPELAALGATGDEAVRVGLAAVLAFPNSGGFGLLMVGMCVDPNQVLEVAAVVAAMAGRARPAGVPGSAEKSPAGVPGSAEKSPAGVPGSADKFPTNGGSA